MSQSSILPFLLWAFIALAAGCGTDNTTATTGETVPAALPAEKPNIVFYLADDQNVYDYGCYGNDKMNTSGVDRLAREGMLFENAFTGQAICAPSRSQLFTGMYPLKNGCFANHTRCKPNIESITAHMGRLGYEVVLAGKSHVGPKEVFGWDRHWESVATPGAPRELLPLDSIGAYVASATKPFCLLIASRLPHPDYYPVDNPRAEDLKFLPYDEHRRSDTSYVRQKARYYRSIEADNEQLEAVLALSDEHLGDNTLFIYSADHGAVGKFTVKDAGLRVPFVVRWPGVIRPGSRSGQLVHYTDVLPTFMAIAGGTPSPEMDGHSFLPLLRGQDVRINDYVFGVRTNQNILRSEVFPSRMIRSDRYKYIRNFNALEVLDLNMGDNPNINAFLRRGALAFRNEPYEELYDLVNDPFEINNLAEQPGYEDILTELADNMFAWMEDQGDLLDGEYGNIPLISPPTKRTYNLDRDTRSRKVADELKNTLTDDDMLLIQHW